MIAPDNNATYSSFYEYKPNSIIGKCFTVANSMIPCIRNIGWGTKYLPNILFGITNSNPAGNSVIFCCYRYCICESFLFGICRMKNQAIFFELIKCFS